jgi:hypothetical protein
MNDKQSPRREEQLSERNLRRRFNLEGAYMLLFRFNTRNPEVRWEAPDCRINKANLDSLERGVEERHIPGSGQLGSGGFIEESFYGYRNVTS